MKRSQNKVSIAASFAVLLVMVFAESISAMTAGPLYVANFEANPGRKVTITQQGSKIVIAITGLGQSAVFDANRGGISTCRTIFEHKSEKASVTVSLAIPDPRARCRMLPSFVSIESRDQNIFLDEEPIKKISGSNPRIRSTAQKVLGKLDQNEG